MLDSPVLTHELIMPVLMGPNVGCSSNLFSSCSTSHLDFYFLYLELTYRHGGGAAARRGAVGVGADALLAGDILSFPTQSSPAGPGG